MTDSGYNQVLVMIDHFHEVCRGRALHNCLGGRDMRPPDQHVDSKTWLSDDVSIG